MLMPIFFRLVQLLNSLRDSTDKWIAYGETLVTLRGLNSEYKSHQSIEFNVLTTPIDPSDIIIGNTRGYVTFSNNAGESVPKGMFKSLFKSIESFLPSDMFHWALDTGPYQHPDSKSAMFATPQSNFTGYDEEGRAQRWTSLYWDHLPEALKAADLIPMWDKLHIIRLPQTHQQVWDELMHTMPESTFILTFTREDAYEAGLCREGVDRWLNLSAARTPDVLPGEVPGEVYSVARLGGYIAQPFPEFEGVEYHVITLAKHLIAKAKPAETKLAVAW